MRYPLLASAGRAPVRFLPLPASPYVFSASNLTPSPTLTSRPNDIMMSCMKKNASAPLYARVEDVLVSEIAAGTFPPGSRLPAEESLTERFAVSRTTIREAIQNLIRRGLIEIRRGTGTFVAQPKISQELTELTGFVEDMQALGRHASARLLDHQTAPANEGVARALELAVGTLVVPIQRVLLAGNIPLSFDEPSLPQELRAKIIENNLEV